MSAKLLEKAKSPEGLTKKEYLEEQIKFAISLLPKPKNTKNRKELEREVEILKNELRTLTPEELTRFISRIVSLSDEEYNKTASVVTENLIKDYKLHHQESSSNFETGYESIRNETKPGCIKELESQKAIYKKMIFEETFEAERGVQYNQNNIIDYAEKDAKMQFLLGVHNKRQQIYDILHNPTVTVQPLIQKVKHGEPLTEIEISDVHKIMANDYYLLSNVMPWYRGSNGICDIYMRSIYRSLGIEMPALKRNVSLDLEAFCQTPVEYEKKWLTFFEE